MLKDTKLEVAWAGLAQAGCQKTGDCFTWMNPGFYDKQLDVHFTMHELSECDLPGLSVQHELHSKHVHTLGGCTHS
jgi:hypothetical protein